MNANLGFEARGRLRTVGALCLMTLAAGFCTGRTIAAGTNVVIWDSGRPFGSGLETENRAGWIRIPSEMFAFEKDPAKAASDPGYYGREYSFKGDAVVENATYQAVFWSAKGRVVIYSKPSGSMRDSSPAEQQVLEFTPISSTVDSATISRCRILRNADDEVAIEAHFSHPQEATTAFSSDPHFLHPGEAAAVFSFGRSRIMEVKPGRAISGINLASPMVYAVVPGFIGDDLLFGPNECASAGDSLCLPSENVLVGLLKGESHELVMTWPKGNQEVKLRTASDAEGKRVIQSIDFQNDNQSFYLTVLSAPGIWHREELKPAYLEKDVPLSWTPPFAAKWKTQLNEAGVRTTFAFRESKGEIWRGVPGSYVYPAWFDGDKAFFHLSKKVPPKGESLIYFLDAENTPLSVSTPADVVQETLGRSMSESILDPLGHTLRTHHRRGGDGVHRCCTCGCTEAIQAVFEAGQEAARKDEIKEALADMAYFVKSHLARIDEYRGFASETSQILQQTSTSAPALKPFVESLRQTVEQIPKEYEVQKENLKSLEHAADLTRETMALTESHNTNNLAAYMELLKAWRAMGGAQDSLVAQCHMIARKLFQQAGYDCVSNPPAAIVAQRVRARCRQILRNPDGYEIWANY
jgi:hypothetical protein